MTATEWVVRNRETGRIESSLLPEPQARARAAQANRDLHTDAYTAEPWKDHTDG